MSIFDSASSLFSNGLDPSTIANSFVTTSLQQARSTVNTRLMGYVLANTPTNNSIYGSVQNQIFGTVQNQINTQLDKTLSVNGVMNTLGISSNNSLQQSNSPIWNNGVKAANGVVSDIQTSIANKTSINASDVVAKASEPLSLLKFSIDNLPSTGAGATKANSMGTNTRFSPYAMDLFKLSPKQKFMFVCEFIFNGGYDFVGEGQARKNEFATIISQFERPRIKYDYEDNVNYYNFRTKIPKRVLHEPLTIKFLDDRKNLSMDFFHKYMLATHPITGVDPSAAALYEQNGMNFSDKSLLSASYTSLPNDDTNTMNILKEIRVYHIYDFGAQMNIYHFTNPKVLSIALDNWDMGENEGNSIVGEFSYDSVTMELGVPVTVRDSDTISTLSDTGTYSLQPNSGGTHNKDASTASVPLGESASTTINSIRDGRW